MSFSRWMGYLWTIEYHSTLKRNENTWRKLKCILLSERRLSVKVTYNMIPTILEKGQTDTVKRLVVARDWKEGWAGGTKITQGTLRQRNNTVWHCDDVYMSFTSVKTHRTYTRKGDPLGKLWTLGGCDKSVQFLDGPRCPALVQDVDSKGGCVYVRVGDIWKISVLSVQFCCEPKTALKNNRCSVTICQMNEPPLCHPYLVLRHSFTTVTH